MQKAKFPYFGGSLHNSSHRSCVLWSWRLGTDFYECVDRFPAAVYLRHNDSVFSMLMPCRSSGIVSRTVIFAMGYISVTFGGGTLNAGLLGLHMEPLLREHCTMFVNNIDFCFTKSKSLDRFTSSCLAYLAKPALNPQKLPHLSVCLSDPPLVGQFDSPTFNKSRLVGLTVHVYSSSPFY